MNRSIQTEESLGNIKQDSGFRRFLCRGRKNVKAEATLLALAHNIRLVQHIIGTTIQCKDTFRSAGLL